MGVPLGRGHSQVRSVGRPKVDQVRVPLMLH